MKRLFAVLFLGALAAATAGLLWAPWWLLAPTLVVACAAMRRGRAMFAAFTVVTVALDAVLFSWLVPTGVVAWRGIGVESAALTGAVAGLRLSAIVGVNLAALSRIVPARLLDALRLPAKGTALLGAVTIAAHDVGRDARRLLDARRLETGWPRRRLAALRAAATLLPALVVAGVRRAEVRRDALQLIGHRTGPRFVPLVAITALAIAGRLALLALPNVKLTYVVVFAGGLLFGARVGVLAGLLSMALTDLLLSGFLPSAFANAAAMGLVGAAGGALGRIDFAGRSRSDRIAGRALAGAVGVFATLLFSMASDALSWLIVPEFRAEPRILPGLIAVGLAFNVVPALANGVLFAACVGPLQQAMRALGWNGAGNRGHGLRGQTVDVAAAGPAVK